MANHARTRQLLAVVILMLFAVAIAGCSSNAGAPNALGGDAAAQPSAPAEEPTGAGGDGGEQPGGNAAPIEQRIVKTGEVGLEVDDVGIVLAQVRALAVELGGYVGGSQAGTRD